MSKQCGINLVIHRFCYFLTFIAISNMPILAAEEFQQAYAPIAVGDITIFIPIDRTPAIADYLVITDDGNNMLLEWQAVPGATRYKIEYYHDGIWKSLNENHIGNTLVIAKTYGAQFRVSSCDIYGCSDWRPISNQISGELMINRFSKSLDAVIKGNQVELSWNVSAAIKIKIDSDKGHHFTGYTTSGMQRFTVNDVTTFTLVANGFSNNYTQKLIVSPISTFTDFERAPVEDAYIQPLLALVRDVNSQVLPIERSLLSVTLKDTTSVNFVAFYDNKLARVDNAGRITWMLDVPGIVANKPLFDEDLNTIYFTVSVLDGSGRICKVSSSGTGLTCLSSTTNGTKIQPVIGSPVVVNEQEKVFFFDSRGGLFAINQQFEPQSLKSHGNISISPNDAVLASLVLDTINNRFIVRTQNNKVFSVVIPASSGSLGQMMKRASAFLKITSSSDATEALDIQWSADLAQEEEQ